MSDVKEPFAARSPADVPRLLQAHPLAWIASGAGERARATLLPLLPVTGTHGELLAVNGHFARSNPQVAALRADGRASVLVCGTQGYISPSWLTDRTWAPTWNYASAHLHVTVEFLDAAESANHHLRELVAAMESGRPRPWSPDEMGARYAQLARHIVPFRATVHTERARFKLGQDERDAVYEEILAGLEQNSQAPLARWMRDFNLQRGMNELSP